MNNKTSQLLSDADLILPNEGTAEQAVKIVAAVTPPGALCAAENFHVSALS